MNNTCEIFQFEKDSKVSKYISIVEETRPSMMSSKESVESSNCSLHSLSELVDAKRSTR
jgi:hypothetical protein